MANQLQRATKTVHEQPIYSHFAMPRRLDVDGSKEVSEAEVSEGIFLLSGAQLDSDGFARFSRGISDNGNLNKDQFKKVRVVMRIFVCVFKRMRKAIFCFKPLISNSKVLIPSQSHLQSIHLLTSCVICILAFGGRP
jgi:hypothetical protein